MTLRIIFVLAFIMFITALIIDTTNNRTLEKPFNDLVDKVVYNAQPYPKDRVKEEQIRIYEDRIVINVADAKYASFADTHSQEPFFGEGSNAIQIAPESPQDIQLGDVITYRSTDSGSLIIHRVISIKNDENGLYYTLKGDNNKKPDPERVRFNQVKSVLIGVIY